MFKITVILLSLMMTYPAWAQDAEPDINSQFIAAVSNSNTENVKALLDKGADVNAKDDKGNPALICAAKKGDADTVKALLEKGADVNAKDNKGSTALKVAKLNGDAETIQLLAVAAENEVPAAEPAATPKLSK